MISKCPMAGRLRELPRKHACTNPNQGASWYCSGREDCLRLGIKGLALSSFPVNCAEAFDAQLLPGLLQGLSPGRDVGVGLLALSMLCFGHNAAMLGLHQVRSRMPWCSLLLPAKEDCSLCSLAPRNLADCLLLNHSLLHRRWLCRLLHWLHGRLHYGLLHWKGHAWRQWIKERVDAGSVRQGKVESELEPVQSQQAAQNISPTSMQNSIRLSWLKLRSLILSRVVRLSSTSHLMKWCRRKRKECTTMHNTFEQHQARSVHAHCHCNATRSS